MKRHARDNYFVVGEGILTTNDRNEAVVEAPTAMAELRKFRFSRLGPIGDALDVKLLAQLAEAMSSEPGGGREGAVPAGFTYLGQFIDHDLTFDRTAAALGDDVSITELIQGRSPALDLDSLYGRGPLDRVDAQLFHDGVRLKLGTTSPAGLSENDPVVNRALAGFDLPRRGHGARKSERRHALIADPRNDQNLVVAQVHLAFLRFHNRVVDHLVAGGAPSASLFEQARELVTLHYQWLIVHDFLPRLVDADVLADVFSVGRRFFEPTVAHGSVPTMPLEFSVAAYRLGHSMIRSHYEWNRVISPASLERLFRYSGGSGNLSPPPAVIDDPEGGSFETLPTSMIADFRRLFDFNEIKRPDLAVPADQFNRARRVDTFLTDPLKVLPLGTINERAGAFQAPPIERNLAFRNLMRAQMVRLASGQQMAQMLRQRELTPDEIVYGAGGVQLTRLAPAQRDKLVKTTPLWFYILREAELHQGVLQGVGARIVAEVFHRALEGSHYSILRDPSWRPTLGSGNQFAMTDLLAFPRAHPLEAINPLGTTP